MLVTILIILAIILGQALCAAVINLLTKCLDPVDLGWCRALLYCLLPVAIWGAIKKRDRL